MLAWISIPGLRSPGVASDKNIEALLSWRKSLPVALRPDPSLCPEARTSKAYGEFLYQLAEHWDGCVSKVLVACELSRKALESKAKQLAGRLRDWLGEAKGIVLNPWLEPKPFSKLQERIKLPISEAQSNAIGHWFSRWQKRIDDFEKQPLAGPLAEYFGADSLHQEVPDFDGSRLGLQHGPQPSGLWSMDSNGAGPPWAEFVSASTPDANAGATQGPSGPFESFARALLEPMRRKNLVPFSAELADLLHERWALALLSVPVKLFELHREQSKSPWTAAFVLDWLVSRDGLIANSAARGNFGSWNFWKRLSPWADQLNGPYRVWIADFFPKETHWSAIAKVAPYPASSVVQPLFLMPDGKDKRNALVRDPAATFGVACFAAFALDQVCSALGHAAATSMSKAELTAQSVARLTQALQIKADNPRMNMRQIAAQVGCSPSTLSRNPAFQRATAVSKSGRIRQGSKDRTGQLEAEDDADE